MDGTCQRAQSQAVCVSKGSAAFWLRNSRRGIFHLCLEGTGALPLGWRTLLSCGNPLDKGHSCCCSLLWPVPCAVLVDELSHSLHPGIPNGIFPLCPVSRLWLGCLIPGGNRDLICSYGRSSQTQEAAPPLCKTPHCKLQALGFISQPWKYWMCLTMNCCLAGLFWLLLGFFFSKAGPEFS